MSNPAITAALIAASQAAGSRGSDRGPAAGRPRPPDRRAQSRSISTGRRRSCSTRRWPTGTVKTTDDGRYYLNERAIADRKEGQGFMVVLILLVIASIMASGIVLVKTAGN